MIQNIEQLLDSKISVRDAISSGYMSTCILSDFDIWKRVQTIKEQEHIPKTHSVEKVSEMCKVSERTVWKAFSSFNLVTDKISAVE